MAYFCRHCRLAVEKRYANCPSCGGNLDQDVRSCDEFADMGYRIVGRRTSQATSEEQASSPFGSVHNLDNDTLESLRRRYRESLHQDEHQDDSDPIQGFGTESAPVRRNEPGDDFFSHYTDVTTPTYEHREILPVEPITYIPPEPLPNRPRRVRTDFSGFGYGLILLIRAIPWRFVFTLLILAGVAGVVMTIWNMRYVIVNSILSFLVELVPVFLIIGGIVYMIKAIFK